MPLLTQALSHTELKEQKNKECQCGKVFRTRVLQHPFYAGRDPELEGERGSERLQTPQLPESL